LGLSVDFILFYFQEKIDLIIKEGGLVLFYFVRNYFFSLRSLRVFAKKNDKIIILFLRLINYINCCSLEGLKEGKFTN